MARAKRTDRTEARRRHRAEQAAVYEDEAVDEPVRATDAEAGAAARRKGTAPAGFRAAPSSTAPTARPARPSFSGAARAAYHQADVRADLAALPRLLIHWTVLVSAALAVAGTAVFLALGASATSTTGGAAAASGTSTAGYVASILVSLFVGPPPFGAALLIGFMLPRATWLAGLVFGFLASACFTVLVLAQPSSTTGGSVPAILAQVWVLGPIGTMFFAAGIAWYRRFLDLLNPNRGQRRQPPQKPQPGRGNAPRNRLSGSSR